MQVSVTSGEGLERKLSIELPDEKIEQEVEKRLKAMTGKVRIAGFRPGKVPLKVVKQRYGQQVRREVEADVARSSFVQALQKENLKPAGEPRLELGQAEEGRFGFTAVIEVYPEVNVRIPDDLTLEKPVVSVSDEDVDKMVEKLRSQRATWHIVDRSAQEGDRVIIDFQGKLDGEPFESGDAQDYPLVIGSGRLIKGFEEQLVGVVAGETRDINVTFPEDYHSEALSGKDAVFTINVKQVEESRPPELEDEGFLAEIGVADGGVEALRSEVRKSMERELAQMLHAKMKEQVLDKLFDAKPIELPSALVAKEVEQLAAEAQRSMGIQPGQSLSEKAREIFADRARRRTALGLLIGEILREQGLKADPGQVREQIKLEAASYEDPQAVVNWYYQDESRLSNVQALVLENTVVDWVVAQARVEEVNKTFDEVMGQSA